MWERGEGGPHRMHKHERTLQQLRGEQYHKPMHKKKEVMALILFMLDGVQTLRPPPVSSAVQAHCSLSSAAFFFFFLLFFFAPAARAERLREIQNIPRLASHLSIISSRQQALFATGKKRGRRLTFSATREHRNLHGLSNNGNIVLLCAKVFTAFHFLSHGKLCER